jgi:hypothetical protein|tara:strand:- start:299 stop:526 length:228 start_codon:yes stop_codon:yes gene_type:complete
MDDYLTLGVFVFIVILSVVKYKCIDTLKESIMEYLSKIVPQKTIEKSDDIIALEELTEEIATLIIDNKELFLKGD